MEDGWVAERKINRFTEGISFFTSFNLNMKLYSFYQNSIETFNVNLRSRFRCFLLPSYLVLLLPLRTFAKRFRTTKNKCESQLARLIWRPKRAPETPIKVSTSLPIRGPRSSPVNSVLVVKKSASEKIVDARKAFCLKKIGIMFAVLPFHRKNSQIYWRNRFTPSPSFLRSPLPFLEADEMVYALGA